MRVNEKNIASGLGRRRKNRSKDEKAAVRWPKGERSRTDNLGKQVSSPERQKKRGRIHMR